MFGGGGRSSGSGSSSGGGGVGGGGGECQNPGGSSSSHPHHHPKSMNINMSMLLPLPPFQQALLSPAASMGVVGACDEDDFPKRDERVVQWGIQETKVFIAIRAELEGEFAVAKRNKALWELVAERMKDLGYRRTPDQCKCKWKNLVNRYKGKETSDLEDVNQFPFFDELHAVFTAKTNHIQLSQVDFEGGSVQSSKKARKVNGNGSPEELIENDDDDGNNESDEDRLSKDRITKNRKTVKGKLPQTVSFGKSPWEIQTASIGNVESTLSVIPEMLRNFFQQQQKIEMQWRESMEKYAQERERFEHEWRQTMERLERERIMMEQAWREREELRKLREESRAEKRDALITTLLNKLIQDKDI